jgi:8-amino-7-oxononanoate synthase
MQQPSWKEEWQKRLGDLEDHGRLRSLRTMEPLSGHRVRIGDRCYLNLASNDYLGLGSDPETHRAFYRSLSESDSLADTGFTASASRLLSGNHPAYAAMEDILESAYGAGKRALVLSSGYHANIGILPALAERGDLIMSDRLNHASLLDGMRLSRAEWIRYRHGDMAHLKEHLAARRGAARRVFIVTESIFSMDGDRADLRALVDLKRTFDAILYVDEAHAAGVRGPKGLGLCEETGTLGDVDILVGTFGKALASVGAFVVSDAVIHDTLVNTMRSMIFTTALPPVVLNWSRHVFKCVLEAGERRERLAANTALFRKELARRNLPTMGDTHIVPLLVGHDKAAVALSERLKQHGYLAPPIRPPTVAEGTARLRFSLGAGMDSAELLALAELIAMVQGEAS